MYNQPLNSAELSSNAHKLTMMLGCIQNLRSVILTPSMHVSIANDAEHSPHAVHNW